MKRLMSLVLLALVAGCVAPSQSVGPDGVHQSSGSFGPWQGPSQSVSPSGVQQGGGGFQPPRGSNASSAAPAPSCKVHCSGGDVAVSCPAGRTPQCQCTPQPQATCVAPRPAS